MPLHLAASVKYNVANVKCLVEAGADVHAKGQVCPNNCIILCHISLILCVIIDRTIKLLYISLSNNIIIPKQ